MIEKTFAEISVGGKFIVNATEFEKIEKVRISCCQSVNAVLVSNTESRVFFQDNTVVSVNA